MANGLLYPTHSALGFPSLQEKIEVMTAALQEKPIQWCEHGTTDWFATSNPIWNWSKCTYRVAITIEEKEEPK